MRCESLDLRVSCPQFISIQHGGLGELRIIPTNIPCPGASACRIFREEKRRTSIQERAEIHDGQDRQYPLVNLTPQPSLLFRCKRWWCDIRPMRSGTFDGFDVALFRTRASLQKFLSRKHAFKMRAERQGIDTISLSATWHICRLILVSPDSRLRGEPAPSISPAIF